MVRSMRQRWEAVQEVFDVGIVGGESTASGKREFSPKHAWTLSTSTAVSVATPRTSWIVHQRMNFGLQLRSPNTPWNSCTSGQRRPMR